MPKKPKNEKKPKQRKNQKKPKKLNFLGNENFQKY